MQLMSLSVFILQKLCSHLQGLCGIHYAADFDEAAIFSELLTCNNLDVMKKSSKGKNVFALAAGSNSVKVLKLLLASDRVDNKEALSSRNDWDETPLHIGK
jgi:hypothetical protein